MSTVLNTGTPVISSTSTSKMLKTVQSEPKKSSPWKVPTPTAIQQTITPAKDRKRSGLLDIMSEQLAQSIETREVKEMFDPDNLAEFVKVEVEVQEATTATTTDSDTLDFDLAMAAQLQEEEDALIWQQERHGPKGNVTVNYFRQQQQFYLAQELQRRKEMQFGEDYAGDYGYEGELDAEPKKRTPPWPVRDKTLKGQGGDGEIITKHDPEINGRKNSRKLESTVPNCGSLGDTIVPNRIYNSLQARMKKIAHSEKGVGSRTVEDDSTRSKTLDSKTRLIIHRLLDAGVLDSVNYVVRTGKEGVIFHAVGPSVYSRARPGKAPFPARSSKDALLGNHEEDSEDEQSNDGDDIGAEELLMDGEPNEQEIESAEFAVKVYKTSLSEFANRHEYVEGDHRFASLGQLSKQNNRKVVKVWAEKELKNMTRMFRAGIPCPEPIRLDRNVLIMSFIGENGWGAPQLADLDFGASSSKSSKCFVQTLLIARALWDRCKLVHADLSEFNILYLRGKCFVVDVGQAVERQHPHALEFLKRDVFNVLTFFYNKCKRTGCGGEDDKVALIVDWIVNGTPDPDYNVDNQDWAEYAKDLGEWADYRLACKFGELV